MSLIEVVFMRKLLMILTCIVASIGLSLAQTTRVSGKVVDDTGESVIGASVVVKGTTVGTVTDVDGKFSMNVPSDKKTLVISLLGMKTKEVAVGTNLNILLEDDSRVMDEVVVTALGISKEKKALGYDVQEIKSDDLTKAGQLSLSGSLAGKVSGVQITTAGGQIGASSRVVVRGNSSLNGDNQPLIVVDGIPVNNRITNKTDLAGVLDLGSGMNDINPADIESVSVLKGASAALYGMEAGNGVILITTKKSKDKSGVKVTYDGTFTVDKVYNLPKMQNKYGQGAAGSEYDYAMSGFTGSYQDYAAQNSFSYLDGNGSGVNDNVDESWGPRLDIGLMLPQFNSPVVDGVRQATPWVSHKNNIKDFFETGFSQNHNVAITSATDRLNVRTAISYRDQQGTVPNTDQKKYTGQINATYKISDQLSFNGLLDYSRTKSSNIPVSGYSASNALQSILQWFGRQVDMKDLKANWNTLGENGLPYNWNSAYHANPYYTLNKNTNAFEKNRVFSKASAIYQPFSFLKFEGRLGYERYDSKTFSKVAYNTDYPDGWFRQYNDTYKNVTADFLAYFDRSFGKLSLSGLAGLSYRDIRYELAAMGSGEQGLTVPELFTMSNVVGTPYTKLDHTGQRSNGVYAQASIGYDNQIYVDVSARNDWVSTVKDDFFYPSISASWLPFETFKSLQNDWLSFLKLRGGWAEIGNGTDPYKINMYSSSFAYTIGGTTQYALPIEYVSDNIKPEKVRTYEFGLDASWFKNRLRTSLTYYTKKTSNQILSVAIPKSTGYSTMLINAGEVQNKGWEVQISADIIKDLNGFSWTSTLNWSKDKSKIVDLYTDPTSGQSLETYTLGSNWSTYVYAVKGQTWGSLYGAGFTYDDQGRVIVDKTTGLPTLTASKKIGDVTPDWLANWSNEFTYKNLSFGFLLDYRQGGDFFSVTNFFGAYTGILDYTAKGDIRERGIIVGKDVLKDKKVISSDGNENTTEVSANDYYYSYYDNKELSVAKGSFLKLREAHITYIVPRKFLARTKYIKDANISLVGSNLAILWLDSSNQAHIDPESSLGATNSGVGFESNSYAPSRSIGLKVGLTF